MIFLWAVYFALLLTAATALVGRKYVNYWRLTTSNQVEHVIGEVVSKHSSKDSLSLKVRFVTHDGRERHIRRTVLHPFGKKQEEGSQVKVTYFSDNPRIARLADGDLDSRSWILFSLMSSGVTLAWAGLLHWVSAAFIPPREHFRFRISPGDEDDFFMLGSGLYFESILSAFPERHDGPILIQSLRSKDQSLPSHDLKVLHERMTKNGIEAQHIADTYLLLKTSVAERLTQRLDIIQGLTEARYHVLPVEDHAAEEWIESHFDENGLTSEAASELSFTAGKYGLIGPFDIGESNAVFNRWVHAHVSRLWKGSTPPELTSVDWSRRLGAPQPHTTDTSLQILLERTSNELRVWALANDEKTANLTVWDAQGWRSLINLKPPRIMRKSRLWTYLMLIPLAPLGVIVIPAALLVYVPIQLYTMRSKRRARKAFANANAPLTAA